MIFQKKGNRFSKVLKSLGLLKKRKKELIIELTDSESTFSEIPSPRKRENPPPFRQEVTNYIMHGQEFYNHPNLQYQRNCHQYHSPQQYSDFMPPINDMKASRYDNYYHHGDPRQFPEVNSIGRPCCSHAPPQVPFCLKEVEIKSIATQSDNKNQSFFANLKKKLGNSNNLRSQYQEDDTYDSSQMNTKPMKNVKEIPKLFSFVKPKIQSKEPPKKFGWKNWNQPNQVKMMDPMKFSLKTQKDLAQGDMKMRNAMMKKLFYKRNPFSPGNIIMKTLLGKDPSSLGEPVGVFRPKMFF